MRGFALALAAFVVALTLVPYAASTQPPIKTVERLAYQRDTAAGDKLVKVQCAATRRAYTYVCVFIGHTACAATYVHYNPHNPSYGKPYKVNFWGESWPCTSTPPAPPPQYPGDGPSA